MASLGRRRRGSRTSARRRHGAARRCSASARWPAGQRWPVREMYDGVSRTGAKYFSRMRFSDHAAAHVSGLPAPIPLVDVQQPLAHVLIFAAAAARPLDRRAGSSTRASRSWTDAAGASRRRSASGTSRRPDRDLRRRGARSRRTSRRAARRRRRPRRCGAASPDEAERAGIGRIDADAEQQPADDRHDVEERRRACRRRGRG